MQDELKLVNHEAAEEQLLEVQKTISFSLTDFPVEVLVTKMPSQGAEGADFIVPAYQRNFTWGQLDFSLWPKNMREVLLEYKEASKIGLSESQVRSLWAGNLDAKKIRENILGRLNLQLSGAERFRDGYDLRRIKDDRNDLAHGIKSWDVVGGNYTWPELVSISNRVLIYTVRFIKTIEVALYEKKWEAPVVASA